MYTRGQALASDKSPCGHSGVSPKFTQTLSYLKLNCRPAWLPLEKHLCTYSEGGERGPQDPGDQTLLSRRNRLQGAAPAAARSADLRNSCVFTSHSALHLASFERAAASSPALLLWRKPSLQYGREARKREGGDSGNQTGSKA